MVELNRVSIPIRRPKSLIAETQRETQQRGIKAHQKHNEVYLSGEQQSAKQISPKMIQSVLKDHEAALVQLSM